MRVKHRILFIISIALFAAFCYSAISRLLFLARAERDVGVVCEVRSENSLCGRRGRYLCTKFYAVVELRADGCWSSPYFAAGSAKDYNQPLSRALYKVGDRVPVVFDPDHPEGALRDKLWDLWGISFVVLLLQIVTLVASFRVPELNEIVTLKLNEGHDSPARGSGGLPK